VTAKLEQASARRYQDLFSFCRRSLPDDGTLLALEEHVLRRFARDRASFSDVLEPSFSWAGGAPSLYRFSYAFPGFTAAPVDASRALLSACVAAS
jgi:hypothetical protein